MDKKKIDVYKNNIKITTDRPEYHFIEITWPCKPSILYF